MGPTRSSPGADSPGRARLFLVGATLFWGASFPLLRALQLAQQAHAPQVPDPVLACADLGVRFGLAALVLLPLFGRHLAHITSREWSQALGLAAFGAAGLFLQTLGLVWTDASISAFLTQLYTLIVPLLVAMRDRRWPRLRIVVACVLVLVGIALLSPGLLSHFIFGPGEIVTVLSTGFLAGTILWVERPIYAENRSGVVTLLMFALLAAFSSLLYPLLGGTIHAATALFGTPVLCELMVAVVVLCTVLTFLIMNTWQRLISATEAGLIYCIEPVIATALCAFVPGWISRVAGIDYPNESLRWGLFFGGSLIIGAAILAATQKRD